MSDLFELEMFGIAISGFSEHTEINGKIQNGIIKINYEITF